MTFLLQLDDKMQDPSNCSLKYYDGNLLESGSGGGSITPNSYSKKAAFSKRFPCKLPFKYLAKVPLRALKLFLFFALVSLVVHFGYILSIVNQKSLHFMKGYSITNQSIESDIPLTIIQSWKTNTIPDGAQAAHQSWKDLNPSHNLSFFNDQDADHFVKTRFPQHYQLYSKFPKSVMRADFFRYLSVYGMGGVWSDIDTECLYPIEKWIPNSLSTAVHVPKINAIIGVELDASDVSIDWFSTQLQFCQWTFAASKGKQISIILPYKTNRSSISGTCNRYHL